MPTIGTSGVTVAPLALGGNTFGWTSDEETSLRVLSEFAAGGGNFVDTADAYSAWVPGNSGGESETILGKWFATTGNRESIVLATKVAKHPDFTGLAPANIARAAEASLQRLRSDYIDLYYAHAEDPNTPIAESVAAFAQLQKAGKVRNIGLSNFSAGSIRDWIAAADDQGVARPVALQPRYNLVDRAAFENNLRAVAQEFNLGVMPYYGLAAGCLTGKYASVADISGARAGSVRGYASDEGFAVVAKLREIAKSHGVEPASVALRWLALQPTIVAPIASARTVEQVAPLLAFDLELSADELAALDSLSALVRA